MKRGAKFRGKLLGGTQFVYGMPHTYGDGVFIIPLDITTDDSITKTMGIMREVDPETVGQFIGLKENAYESAELNKGIYDGDIIEFIDGRLLAVEWNDDTCQWQFSDGSPLNSGDNYYCHKRIVGNIHDNPELLK